MPKSLLLRDRQGNIGGYVLIKGAGLCCRVLHLQKGAVLTVISPKKTLQEFSLSERTDEVCWNSEISELTGAYIRIDHECILASDEDARMHSRTYRNKEEKESNAHRFTKDTSLCVKERAESCSQSKWPQARWPAPVLFMHPIYREGAWEEEKENL